MIFFEILHTLLIGPLKLLFEIIFEIANCFTGHPGLSIIFLSLIMNILVLPLYRRADAMQEQAREMDQKLHEGVAHIKKTFSGDEKMMILQTYYRQNHYKPTDMLKGSVSLLLEIPFFMAAYQFLSHLESLRGVSLGPVADLSTPDGLLVIGGFAINVLPVIMTLVNVISSYIYLKGFPMKTKIQLYGMALFFLIFLYRSPSGLVFYWSLNNLFSLIKTIFYKLKNPQRVLSVLLAVLGLPLFVYAVGFYDAAAIKKKVFLVLIALILEAPLVWRLIKPRLKLPQKKADANPNRTSFITGSVFLTILTGVLIPSALIAASPQEFVDVTYFHHPLWYLVRSAAMSGGTFLVWMRVFYWLASPSGKVFFDRLIWVFCGLMFSNYMFFGTKLGIISATLQYESGLYFSRKEQLVNIGVLVLLSAVLLWIAWKWNRLVTAVLLTASIAVGVMSVVNMVTIKTSVDRIALTDEVDNTVFELSREGKNVIVLMLDRGMGEYIPYIMNEKPKLREQFAGFTYYSNVISFGALTNFGIPALLGGYEYTPVELNSRAEEPLVVKHNEALQVMPVLFADNGYDVTVCDPVYAGYQWIPDLSIYDGYSNINACITKGHYSDTRTKQRTIEDNQRNFFCFSIMKTMPLFVQPIIYRDGTYNQSASESGMEEVYSGQVIENVSKAKGINAVFMESYSVLCNLPGITKTTEDDKNTFLFMVNDTTHEPLLLQEPEYVPAQDVDNTAYDEQNQDRFTVDGRTMRMENETQFSHYQVNMAALLKLGEWFDYLRKEGVYDNTRIIIVSDHGRGVGHFDELSHDGDAGSLKNVEFYYPLLMVKDFDSTEFTTSDEFMTNADVPTLAVSGLIEDPVNPFTGKLINSDEKSAHDQYVIISSDWQIEINNGNTFLPAGWARVKDNLWDKDNWEFYDESVVLDEYRFPDED